jgi:cytochrome c oxidase assembly factor CtaG
MVTAQVNAHGQNRASSSTAHNAGVVIAAVQPVLALFSAGSLTWYLRRTRALPATIRWPVGRTTSFALGLGLLLAATCGPITSHTRSSFSLWLGQALLLILILPIPLIAGQPVELARLSGERRPDGTGGQARRPLLARLADTGPGRLAASPIVGAGLIPLACVVFLFGPIPAWSIRFALASWVIQLAMLMVGLVIVLPLISTDTTSSSLAIGAAIAVGLFELLIDAVPGIVMRLSTHPVTSFFDYRVVTAGQQNWLHDQQFAGGILWCVAELLDLPFLILIFRRWVQADAREAAVVDAQPPVVGGPDDGQPWFLSDPRLRDRFR